jgi:hypothetical protein
MPATVQPEELNCVFMLDNEHRVITFFHKWMNTVMNVSGARGAGASGLPMGQIEYKSSYAASELTVRHYSAHDSLKNYEFRYNGVYPTQVGNIDMAWSNKDTIATVTVNFSYSKLIYQGFANLASDATQDARLLQNARGI